MDAAAEGRRLAMEELRGLGRRVAQQRLLSAVRKEAPAPAAQQEAAPSGPSLLERYQALQASGG